MVGRGEFITTPRHNFVRLRVDDDGQKLFGERCPSNILMKALQKLSQPAKPKFANRSELMLPGFLLRANSRFQEWLQMHSSHDNSALFNPASRQRATLELLSKDYAAKKLRRPWASALGPCMVTEKIFDRLTLNTRTETVMRYLKSNSTASNSHTIRSTRTRGKFEWFFPLLPLKQGMAEWIC